MKKVIFYLYMVLFGFTYADDFVHQKEVVFVYGTTLEITENCKLFITYKNKKREEVPFLLNNLKHCSLMRSHEFDTGNVAYIAAYGDYIFTVQAPVWDKEYKEYHVKTVKVMITKPEGKVYFSKIGRGGGYPLSMEKWQYRVEAYRIRKQNKLPLERLEVEHRDFINRDK